MRAGLPFAALFLIPIATACGTSSVGMGEMPSRDELDSVASKRIFFGHQSVGKNIIEGLETLYKGQGLKVVEGRAAKALESPAFLHSALGVNGDPSGKIVDFVSIIEGGVGGKADVAIMKFCYVDITARTDVEALFAQYRSALARLSSEYPNTAFPMVSVPLTTVERGPKAFAKQILGKPIRGADDNLARERFNELARESAGGEDLFDLASIEATGPDGSASSARALRNEYSSDGGHLNEPGSRLVAERLVAFLAALKAKD